MRIQRLIAAICCALSPCVSLAQDSVKISEFMATNESVIADEDGDFSDWLELYNAGSTAVDLNGWYLTDNAASLRKWRIPARTLPPGGFLLVWASDKMRTGDGPLHTNFKLSASGEFLALVKPDGVTISDSYTPTFPVQTSNVSYGYAFAQGLLQDTRRYFLTSTPAAPNSEAPLDQGPVIVSVAGAPSEPTDAQAVTVRAVVLPGGQAVSNVSLAYRVNYGSEVVTSMFDDGAHGDGAAGDATFGAAIPPSASAPGDMLRWRVTATDVAARESRSPLFADATHSPQYFGAVVSDGTSSPLPILRWFMQDPAAADTDEGSRATVSYRGVFYDNVRVSLEGQTSRQFPKKSYKFDFNPGALFLYDPAKPAVEEFDLITTYSDKSFVRIPLAWEVYRSAGNVHSDAFPLHVRQNNAFFSVAVFVEEPDERYLERNHLDDEGALYKMGNDGSSSTFEVEKKNRKFEGRADLETFLAGVQPATSQRETFLFDNVDLARTLNYLAATVILNDNDHIAKNYYLYRDSARSLEWTMLPWDKELTFGRHYNPFNGGVLNDDIWAEFDPFAHPLFGDRSHPKIDNLWNRIVDALYSTPRIRQMFLRRLRSLMDQELQTAGTPLAERRMESRIEALKSALAADVALDAARWGLPNWGSPQTMSVAADVIITDYLPRRRNHLFGTHSASGLIPAAQVSSLPLRFGITEPSPASLDQDEEFIEIQNRNSVAVDISHWRLSGDVTQTFRPGTVIPAGDVLFATPNARAFRSRTDGPTGGEGRLVQGDYDGHLGSACDPVTLTDSGGFVAAKMCGCAPRIRYDDDGASCAATPVTLRGPSDAHQYLWSTGETTESIVVSPLSTASFSLRTLDAAACATPESRITRIVLPNVPPATLTLTLNAKPLVCPSCALIEARVTEEGGGPSNARQWGYRASAGGPFIPIPGATGLVYRPVPSDFPGEGSYLLMAWSTTRCGAPAASNQKEIVVLNAASQRLKPPRKTSGPASVSSSPAAPERAESEASVGRSPAERANSGTTPNTKAPLDPQSPLTRQGVLPSREADQPGSSSDHEPARSVVSALSPMSTSALAMVQATLGTGTDADKPSVELTLETAIALIQSVTIDVGFVQRKRDPERGVVKEGIRSTTFAPGELKKTVVIELEAANVCEGPGEVEVSLTAPADRVRLSVETLVAVLAQPGGCVGKRE